MRRFLILPRALLSLPASDKTVSDSGFSLPLAPLLTTAQAKPGESQEEEANSGEVKEVLSSPSPHHT